MHSLNTQRLAALVRSKRADRGLREVSIEIGEVSPSTLSRVENERAPDMETFLLLCNWLQVAPSEFFRSSEDAPPSSKPISEQIGLQLRADRNLDPTTANVLATLVEAAYRDLGKPAEGQ